MGDQNHQLALHAEVFTDESGIRQLFNVMASMNQRGRCNQIKLHFEPRMVELHIDREGLNEAFENLTEDLDEEDKINWQESS